MTNNGASAQILKADLEYYLPHEKDYRIIGLQSLRLLNGLK
jgi:hypothetical protein